MKEGDKIEGGPFDGFEVISVYSRADALADGVLVDVSEIAKANGWPFNTAMTDTAYGIATGHDDNRDPRAALRDVFNNMTIANSMIHEKSDRVFFGIVRDGERHKLYALSHAGDNGEACITIMLEGED